MKWKMLGQIFSAQEHGFLYAKSPQAILFADFVRVYFSACEPDGDKLISYVAYVDFDKDFSRVLRTSRGKEVMKRGSLGCFDEHGIFPFSPLRDDGRIIAYTSGWSRRVSVSVDTAIGLAVSHDDGETFQRAGGGPVLAASLQEPFLIVDAFVRKYRDLYHMWYIFGTEWCIPDEGFAPERIYKIGHAVSLDGQEWMRNGEQIIRSKSEYESQALPSVLYDKNRYHMMFCYRNSFDFRTNRVNSYSIGYAFSDDLIHWTRMPSCGIERPAEGWDSEMQCYPHLFTCDDSIYLLYNGNRFGEYGFGLAKLIEWE